MNALIAFEVTYIRRGRTATLVYILPQFGQPRYVAKQGIEQASQIKGMQGVLNLLPLNAGQEILALQTRCQQSKDIHDQNARQALYVWWMGLGQAERNAYFK